MVINATFTNISCKCISWRSVLLVEEIWENQRPAASLDIYHIRLYLMHLPSERFEGTDCICRHKSNYHTIPTTTAPDWIKITKCVQYFERDYILCMTSCYLFTNDTLQSVSVARYTHLTTLLLEKCGSYSCRKYWKHALRNDNSTMNSWYMIHVCVHAH